MQVTKAVSKNTGLVIAATGDPNAPADRTLKTMWCNAGDPTISNEFGAVYEVYFAHDDWKLYVAPDGTLPTDYVIAPTSRIIGRDELGSILPNGWHIEQSLNCYTPFMGDDISLAPQKSMRLAISAIRAFLSTMAAQSSTDLAASYAAELSSEGSAKLEQQSAMEF